MMKACVEHRHEHRHLPCPWPDCANGESAPDTLEIARHAGAGQMTPAEGHFDVLPPPRVFERKRWTCDKCEALGWVWIEGGAEPRVDRCPHRRPRTVQPRSRT